MQARTLARVGLAGGTALISTVVVAGLGDAAQAAPVNAPSVSIPVTVNCGTLGTATTITNSGRSQAVTWNPFFVINTDGRQTLIDPTALDLMFKQNGTTLGSINASKGGAGGQITCTVSGQSGSFSVTGSISGNLH